jgi:hypothetical protein
MPDGDRVHSHLRGFYKKPYKMLCEGVARPEECARIVLDVLRSDLKQIAKVPFLLARNISDLLSQKIGPLEFSNDFAAAGISRQIDELIRQVDGPSREKELISRTSKTVLNDLRHGREMDASNVQLAIFNRYIRDKYDAEFKERIPLSNDHHHGVSHSELMRRLEALEPYLDLGFHKFAQTAIKDQNLDNLRLPRQFRREINLDEDLLAC